MDAGRLAAISHFCNPMTILVVIGTGLLHKPEAGYLLLIVHWISGLLAAWIFGLFHKPVSSEDTRRFNSTLHKVRTRENAQRPYLKGRRLRRWRPINGMGGALANYWAIPLPVQFKP